jgi:hypothetical protein
MLQPEIKIILLSVFFFGDCQKINGQFMSSTFERRTWGDTAFRDKILKKKT